MYKARTLLMFPTGCLPSEGILRSTRARRMGTLQFYIVRMGKAFGDTKSLANSSMVTVARLAADVTMGMKLSDDSGSGAAKLSGGVS